MFPGVMTHIVLFEETKVTNHAKPDEQCGCPQQDTADIIVCQVLQDKIRLLLEYITLQRYNMHSE